MRAQSNKGTARSVVGRPFTKGKSGNPGGRPAGIVRAIRDQTGDGQEMVSLMVAVMRGEIAGARVKDRMDAATWLSDRAFGKPQVTDPVPVPVNVTMMIGGSTDDYIGSLRRLRGEVLEPSPPRSLRPLFEEPASRSKTGATAAKTAGPVSPLASGASLDDGLKEL